MASHEVVDRLREHERALRVLGATYGASGGSPRRGYLHQGKIIVGGGRFRWSMMKTFSAVTLLIISATSLALVFVVALEGSPPDLGQAIAPLTAPGDAEPAPPPPPQALPPAVEIQGSLAPIGAEQETRAPTLQTARRPESIPDESKADMTALWPTQVPESTPSGGKSDMTARQPTPGPESRPGEIRTAEDKRNAAPGDAPVSAAPHPNEQETTADETPAVRLLRRLAEQGNRQAQYNLAVMYANGRGVPRDEAEANRWYRRAAEQGDASAQSLVGSAYLFGRGVPKDFVQAYLWLDLAARGSEKSAAKVRDDLERFMTAAQISEARKLAREWKPK